MLAQHLKLLSGTFLGRSFVTSRGNYLLPAPPTAEHPGASVVRSYIGTFMRGVTRETSACTSTSTVTAVRISRTIKPSVNISLCWNTSVKRSVSQGSSKLISNLTGRSLTNQRFTMPKLRQRAGSVRDLIIGKKKRAKTVAESDANGEVEDAETASIEPTSPDSTDVASPDAGSTNAESVVPESPVEDEEEEKAPDDEEEAELVVDESAPADPEPEPTNPDGGVDLQTVVKKLETFAPLSLAEDWDNVGLLVEPSSPHVVNKVFLTNDLTEEVLEEAITEGSNFILSYHPPIFSPLKRLTMKTEKERIILKAIENGIAIYSPHTTHDAVKGGVNDWLLSAFGDQGGSAILSNSAPQAKQFKLEISVTKQFKQKVQEVFSAENGSLSKVEKTGDGSYHFKSICDKSALVSILSALKDKNVKKSALITKLFPDPCNDVGMGRFVNLAEALSLEDCVAKVKSHLEVEHVQLALGKGKTLESSIESVAVCAGSGSKVLEGTTADLYLTGEMSHHEVLAAVAKGTSVITSNHSNSERGYLKELKTKLEGWLGNSVAVQVSEVDADPLKVV